MTQFYLSLFALIGAPASAAYMGWRMYQGEAWRQPLCAWTIVERVGAAGLIAISVFNGWLLMCDRILGTLQP